jgi:hypothetical protein
MMFRKLCRCHPIEIVLTEGLKSGFVIQSEKCVRGRHAIGDARDRELRGQTAPERYC